MNLNANNEHSFQCSFPPWELNLSAQKQAELQRFFLDFRTLGQLAWGPLFRLDFLSNQLQGFQKDKALVGRVSTFLAAPMSSRAR